MSSSEAVAVIQVRNDENLRRKGGTSEWREGIDWETYFPSFLTLFIVK